MATIRARLATGEVEGAHVGATAVLKGIPFATISTRFGPHRCLGRVRPAVAFGPPPPPSSGLGDGAATGDEADWLTANVWSPDLTGTLPVPWCGPPWRRLPLAAQICPSMTAPPSPTTASSS